MPAALERAQPVRRFESPGGFGEVTDGDEDVIRGHVGTVIGHGATAFSVCRRRSFGQVTCAELNLTVVMPAEQIKVSR
jgi:hypothetical protein